MLTEPRAPASGSDGAGFAENLLRILGPQPNDNGVKRFWPLFRRRAALVYPVLPAPPTAVLVPWLRSRGDIRVFEHGWSDEVKAFRPSAVCGTWAQIQSLLPQRIEYLTHAVIVVARSPAQLLTSGERQQIWRAFRVPVFEQIIGANGLLLAAECEAHAGLHVESPKLNCGDHPMETAVCGCGRTTPRLKAADQAEPLRSVTAYAR